MSKTVKDVPIVETGIEYPTSTGKVTFTEADLASIVESQSDPAIVAPRLKLGHSDPRFNMDDGEPAFGIAQNLHLDNAGHTLLCDYAGVPDWLAEVMPTAYPSRSIEGNWDVETVTGHKWPFVVTAVALLGVVWPGISTLDDLEISLSDAGPEEVMTTNAAASVVAETVSDAAWNFSDSDYDDAQYARACVYDRGKCSDASKNATAKQRYSLRVREPSGALNRNGVHAAASRFNQVSGGCDAAKKAAATTLVNMYKNSLKEEPPTALTNAAASVKSSANMEDIRRSFYDNVATQENDQYWWWIRAVMLDPNELIVDDDEGGLYRIPFTTQKNGDVKFSDPVPVKIKYVDQPVSASVAGQVIAASYSHAERTNVKVEADQLRKVLGLQANATEEEVTKILAEKADETPAAPEPTTPDPDQDESGSEGEESGEEEGEEAPTVPPGTTPPGMPGAPPQPGKMTASGAVLVDRETLNTLQRNANMGVEAYERQRKSDRDAFLHAAVVAGKFPPARMKHWTDAWERDPDGIKAQIESMPAGLIPVGQLGIAPQEEGDNSPAYSPSLFPQLQKRKSGSVMQET